MGIDIGTASSKGVLATPEGRIVARPQREHGCRCRGPAGPSTTPSEVWWGDVAALCRELIAERRRRPLAGGRASAASGRACCRATPTLRRCGRRSCTASTRGRRAEIDELTERYGADAILARGGKALSSQAVGPEAAVAAPPRARGVGRARRAGTWRSSFVVARLTGEYVLDHHSASQCDPLYDLAARAGPQRLGGRRSRPGSSCRGWRGRPRWSARSPAAAAGRPACRAGTPVVAGTVDAWAEAFSVGVRAPGDLMLMYGSTMFFVQVLRAAPAARRGCGRTPGVEPGTVHAGRGHGDVRAADRAGCSELTGGVSFERRWSREAAATPPGADGLLALPYFAGERTPIFDPRRPRRDRRADAAARAAATSSARSTRASASASARSWSRVGGGRSAGADRGGGRRHPRRAVDADRVRRHRPRAGDPAQTIGAATATRCWPAIGTGLVPAATRLVRGGPGGRARSAHRAVVRGAVRRLHRAVSGDARAGAPAGAAAGGRGTPLNTLRGRPCSACAPPS